MTEKTRNYRTTYTRTDSHTDKADRSKGDTHDTAYTSESTHTHDAQATSADDAMRATHAEKSGKGEEHVHTYRADPTNAPAPSDEAKE